MIKFKHPDMTTVVLLSPAMKLRIYPALNDIYCSNSRCNKGSSLEKKKKNPSFPTVLLTVLSFLPEDKISLHSPVFYRHFTCLTAHKLELISKALSTSLHVCVSVSFNVQPYPAVLEGVHESPLWIRNLQAQADIVPTPWISGALRKRMWWWRAGRRVFA